MKGSVILVTREGMGEVPSADQSFRSVMLEKFLHTLEALPDKPTAICFYTDGVKLVVAGSPVVPALQLLEGMGVRLVACRTCLEYFGLADSVAVGSVDGMRGIVDLMASATKVITL